MSDTTSTVPEQPTVEEKAALKPELAALLEVRAGWKALRGPLAVEQPPDFSDLFGPYDEAGEELHPILDPLVCFQFHRAYHFDDAPAAA
jgi:hypothetical protein